MENMAPICLIPPPNSDAEASQLLSKRQLAEMLGVNPFSIDRWRRTDPTFPKPFWLTGTTPRWHHSDVAAWLASRQRGGISPDWVKAPRRKSSRQ
jgi:predicted DNA-binding transcriptional regulator AlpA